MPPSLATTLRPPATRPLHGAFAAGRRAYPELDLSFASFVGRLGEKTTPRAAADYYLARACDAGAPGAWEKLRERYGRRLRAFLRKRGATAPEAEELLDDAFGALAAPPARGGTRTAIGTYDGRGSLYAWLATIVWRRLADRWRERCATTGAGAAVRARSVRPEDPATRAADAETARLLGRALEEAWSGLTTRELQAVVLKYRYQLPQTEIARTLKVGPPRVTRLLHSAMARLRGAVEDRFGSQPDWDAPGGGWESLFEVVERILARSAADSDVPRPGSTDDE